MKPSISLLITSAASVSRTPHFPSPKYHRTSTATPKPPAEMHHNPRLAHRDPPVWVQILIHLAFGALWFVLLGGLFGYSL